MRRMVNNELDSSPDIRIPLQYNARQRRAS